MLVLQNKEEAIEVEILEKVTLEEAIDLKVMEGNRSGRKRKDINLV